MKFPDPNHDPTIARALRRVGADETHSQRELTALERRIVAGAERQLRRRRQHGTWWEYALAWRRTLVPIALSAAALAMFGILTLSPRRDDMEVSGGARPSSDTELLGAAANRVSSGDLIELMVAEADGNATRATGTRVRMPEGSRP